ncbi:MAG: ABC-2 family transporter protein [Lachnospiraceae bacterium]|nr:ABC-2 family transporter protein [Lachnospiraceae bacterium]
MKRILRVLKELIRLRFQKLMLFRLGFFGPFFVDGSLFVVQLLVFRAVYENVDSIGGWQRGEMILYIGTFSLLNAVNMVVYFFGVNGLPHKIKSGEMDLYLTKPVSPLFRITFEQINPGSLPLVFMSFCILAYGVGVTGLELTLKRLLIYGFWVVLMQILYYDMEVILRSVTFFFVSGARMDQVEYMGLDLCMQLPGVAFYGVYKVIFYCILPYGIMATLPVQSLIGEMTPGLAVFGLAVVVVFSGLTSLLWRTGVRHYHSASS